MPSDDQETRQIEAELLERLGRVVIGWARVERLVADLFSATLIKSDAGQPVDPGSLIIVTQNVSLATLTAWIRTMIEVRQTPDETALEIREMLNEVDELRAERNALVHGLWGTDKSLPGTVMVQTTRLERREMIRDELVTAKDLDHLDNGILRVTKALIQFLSVHSLPHTR